MRPTTIMSLLAAAMITLGGIGFGVYFLWDRPGGREWFYWAAPLFVLVFGLTMASVARQYWVRVGKLEVKGRPRSA